MGTRTRENSEKQEMGKRMGGFGGAHAHAHPQMDVVLCPPLIWCTTHQQAKSPPKPLERRRHDGEGGVSMARRGEHPVCEVRVVCRSSKQLNLRLGYTKSVQYSHLSLLRARADAGWELG